MYFSDTGAVFEPSNSNYIIQKTMGQISEVIVLLKQPLPPTTRKVDKDNYVNILTGELLEYLHISDRSESKRSLRNTIRRISDLINANCYDPSRILWATLTYKENMVDTKQLYSDFDSFRKRLEYWYESRSRTPPKYISVIEPQGRGAWHVHLILIFESKAKLLARKTLSDLWGHGFVDIKRAANCDNLGAYFSAYLADLPLDDFDNLPAIQKELLFSGLLPEKTLNEKKYIKGGRLHLYPPGMNILRHSQGLDSPNISKGCNVSFIQENAEFETYRRYFDIFDDDGNKINTVCKIYYNANRKRSE